MYNTDVEELLNNCKTELIRIEHLILGVGSTHDVSHYLTKYALMNICGTLERAYKGIIVDHYKSFSRELARFIDINVTDASLNASYDNICKVLGMFSEQKKNDFKERIQNLEEHNRYLLSFSSLNNQRNNLVHGLHMNASFLDIKEQFNDSLFIINVLDVVMNENGEVGDGED